MNQRTHTWLAVRAIALLEETSGPAGLVSILKDNVKGAAIGSWIPDLRDTKPGSGDIDNHILKMKPYKGANKSRFVKRKKALVEELGKERMVCKFLDDWGEELDKKWWDASYKAEPSPGQHLANRAMALSTTIIDQLILADEDVAGLVPGETSFAADLDDNARTRAAEVATYLFMQSHFVADACQPCHCDARKLSGYDNGLHKKMEGDWSKRIGTYFEKEKYLENGDSPDQILDEARSRDSKFGITFSDTVPEMKARDAWLEVINISRASFAVASILVPPSKIPYASDVLTSFDEVFKSPNSDPDFLPAFNRMVMHDAVLNIAIHWNAIWSHFD